LLLAIDDNTHKKTGRKVMAPGSAATPVRSTTFETVFCWALPYAPLCLVFHPPWGGEPLALSLNIRPNRKNRRGVTLPKPAELAKKAPAGEWRLVETRKRGRIRERLVYAGQVLWAEVSKKPILFIIRQGKKSTTPSPPTQPCPRFVDK
jgi:hypothetical protein